MRLGFSVAAFLEPDVLLVDEVLAVGDAAFQQRCLAKMRDVLSNGTSLVFVSHDLASVEAICTRGIWMQTGSCRLTRPSRRRSRTTARRSRRSPQRRTPATVASSCARRAWPATRMAVARTFEPLEISLTLEPIADYHCDVVLGISEGTANPMLVSRETLSLYEGSNTSCCRLDRLPLPHGRFFVWAAVYLDGQPMLRWHPATPIDVVGPELPQLPPGIMRQGRLIAGTSWHRDDGTNASSDRGRVLAPRTD